MNRKINLREKYMHITSAPLDIKKFAKKREKIRKKREKMGKKRKYWEGSFTLPLLTDRAGYTTE